MIKPLLFLLAVAVAFAAGEDPWAKVKDLKSGTEIRIARHRQTDRGQIG